MYLCIVCPLHREIDGNPKAVDMEYHRDPLEEEVETLEDTESAGPARGTRHYPLFQAEREPSMVLFHDHLMTIDSGPLRK